jgi:hypothetical protein
VHHPFCPFDPGTPAVIDDFARFTVGEDPIGNLPAAFGGTRDPFEAALEAALGIGRP